MDERAYDDEVIDKDLPLILHARIGYIIIFIPKGFRQKNDLVNCD